MFNCSWRPVKKLAPAKIGRHSSRAKIVSNPKQASQKYPRDIFYVKYYSGTAWWNSDTCENQEAGPVWENCTRAVWPVGPSLRAGWSDLDGPSVPQVCSWSPSLWLSCASQPEQTASIKVTTGRKTGKNRRNQSTVFWSCWWSRQPEKFGFVNLFVHQTMWMGGDRRWLRSYHGLVKSFFLWGRCFDELTW